MQLADRDFKTVMINTKEYSGKYEHIEEKNGRNKKIKYKCNSNFLLKLPIFKLKKQLLELKRIIPYMKNSRDGLNRPECR